VYEYRVIIDRWVDGDTVDVDIDLGFGVWLKDQRVRLAGINTPESRTRDLEEKARGKAAHEFARKFAPEGEEAKLVCKSYDSKGKFGRILGEIWSVKQYSDQSVNQYLLENGHATVYHGGKR
tara:strand:- start:56 stop:421 length:366 start_codon:yes stop_codon:yes gene_type:complete